MRSCAQSGRRTDSERVELGPTGTSDHLQDVEVGVIAHLTIDERFRPLDNDLRAWESELGYRKISPRTTDHASRKVDADCERRRRACESKVVSAKLRAEVEYQQSKRRTDDTDTSIREQPLCELAVVDFHACVVDGYAILEQRRERLVCSLVVVPNGLRPSERGPAGRSGSGLFVRLEERFGGLRASFASVAEDEDAVTDTELSFYRRSTACRCEVTHGFPEEYRLMRSYSLKLSETAKAKSFEPLG